MKLEDMIDVGIGVFTLSSATAGCFAYGVSDAKGMNLPGRMYVWPATGLGAYYLGRQIGIPDNFDPKGNVGIYLIATGGLGVLSYGLGYAAGKLLDLAGL